MKKLFIWVPMRIESEKRNKSQKSEIERYQLKVKEHKSEKPQFERL
jgi:hypothetical protein